MFIFRFLLLFFGPLRVTSKGHLRGFHGRQQGWRQERRLAAATGSLGRQLIDPKDPFGLYPPFFRKTESVKILKSPTRKLNCFSVRQSSLHLERNYDGSVHLN
jgi:hypothetical protein